MYHLHSMATEKCSEEDKKPSPEGCTVQSPHSTTMEASDPHGRCTPHAANPPNWDTGPCCSLTQGTLMKISWNKLEKKIPLFYFTIGDDSFHVIQSSLVSLSTNIFHCIWNLSLAKHRREKHLEITSFENYATNAAVAMNNVCWHSLNILQIIYRSQQNADRAPGPETELVCFMLVKPFSLNKIQSLGTAWTFQMAFSLYPDKKQ